MNETTYWWLVKKIFVSAWWEIIFIIFTFRNGLFLLDSEAFRSSLFSLFLSLSLFFFLGANSAFVLIVQTSIMCVSWLHRAPFQKEKIKRRRRNSKMKRRAHKSGQRSHIIEDTTENESDTQSKRKCSMNQHKPKNMESKKSTK